MRFCYHLLLLFIVLCVAPAATALPPTLRVSLLESAAPQQIEVRAEGMLRLAADGRAQATLAAGQTLTVRTVGDHMEVSWPGGHQRISALYMDGAAEIHLRVVQGREQITRSYKGALACASVGGQLQLINHVGMDEYVASVVASEYPFTEREGVKAQAVAVRTYAAYQIMQASTREYDVKDNASSQIYKGAGAATAVSQAAALETAGQILTHGGQPILAAFYSSSGGHTADNETIWNGTPVSYLRARPDPYDTASPYHRWTFRVDRHRLLRTLSSAYGFDVSGLSINERSTEGRVITVDLHGRGTRTVRGNDFRMKITQALGITTLRSTLFDLDLVGNEYVFEGHGFGHGIGLSQYGARAMAQQGHSYTEILSFYYTGVRIETQGNAPRPSVAATSYTEPRPASPIRTARTSSSTYSTRRGW